MSTPSSLIGDLIKVASLMQEHRMLGSPARVMSVLGVGVAKSSGTMRCFLFLGHQKQKREVVHVYANPLRCRSLN